MALPVSRYDVIARWLVRSTSCSDCLSVSQRCAHEAVEWKQPCMMQYQKAV